MTDMRLAAIAVGMLLAVTLASCSSSGSAKFVVKATGVTAYGPSTVGVAFNVHNVGNGTGQPNCTVTAAVSASDGGTNGVVLQSIKPGQWDYEAASSDKVDLSGTGASLVSIADGGVAIKC